MHTESYLHHGHTVYEHRLDVPLDHLRPTGEDNPTIQVFAREVVRPGREAAPYAVFLLRQSFRQIPQEIIDAATMDGAGQVRILFSIVVPISKPIISTLVLITVVSQWNSFLWPRIIAATRPRVLTVATAALQSQYNANWTYVMAATTIALVPLIALFIIFQRHIVESIALTGIK